MMKKFLPIFLLFMLLPLPLARAATLGLMPEEGALGYSISLPNETFVVLSYTAPAESGQVVLYDANGLFEGKLALPLSQAGGKIKVTIENLKEKQLAEGTAVLPAAASYAAPVGTGTAKVRNLALEETAAGLRYSFSAPGADYLILHFRCKQQSGSFPIYAIDDTGRFAGEISLPLTYARTLVTVKILNGNSIVMAEAQARKGYEAPAAPAPETGRLSGVTVCIDPGHQENGERVTEPIGPGLEGKTAGTGGMAQGKITQRKEAIVTLEVGMALRDELIRQGATVVMTRERQDIFVSNLDRCEIAAQGGADIMLRLHCDLQENQNKRGISIYAPLHSTYAQAVADPPVYRAMGEMLLDAMKRAVGYELAEKTGFVTLSDQFVGNNWAKMPCFLIEMGFMSNPQEDVLMSTPVYQQWLAQGMAQGVYEIALYRGLISEAE